MSTAHLKILNIGIRKDKQEVDYGLHNYEDDKTFLFLSTRLSTVHFERTKKKPNKLYILAITSVIHNYYSQWLPPFIHPTRVKWACIYGYLITKSYKTIFFFSYFYILFPPDPTSWKYRLGLVWFFFISFIILFLPLQMRNKKKVFN